MKSGSNSIIKSDTFPKIARDYGETVGCVNRSELPLRERLLSGVDLDMWPYVP